MNSAWNDCPPRPKAVILIFYNNNVIDCKLAGEDFIGPGHDDNRRMDAAPERRMDRRSNVRFPSPLEARALVRDEPAHRSDPCRDGQGPRLRRDALRLARPRWTDDHQRRSGSVLSSTPRSLRRRSIRRSPPAHGRRARASSTRSTGRLQGAARSAMVMGIAARRPTLLPALRRMLRARYSVLHPGWTRGSLERIRAGTSHPVSRSRRPRISRASHRGWSYRRSLVRGDAVSDDEVSERLRRHVGLQNQPI